MNYVPWRGHPSGDGVVTWLVPQRSTRRCVMTSSALRRSGITVVFVITGVFVCVVSTPRQLAVAERLLVCPRRRAKQLARAATCVCGSVLSLVAACGLGFNITKKVQSCLRCLCPCFLIFHPGRPLCSRLHLNLHVKVSSFFMSWMTGQSEIICRLSSCLPEDLT